MEVGQIFTQTITVREQDAAAVMGSGSLMVFATPAMVAYMENTAMKMVQADMPEGSDTVGIEINVKHIKASLVGAKITFSAEITAIEGRKIVYTITAKDEKGDEIGSADHQRFVIDKERFLSKLK
ncbi:MAG: thioesterase family protein [Paludibacteraceae bacterium]|nr:thioesterase family protein [Paludibacteraceae bacterium]